MSRFSTICRTHLVELSGDGETSVTGFVPVNSLGRRVCSLQAIEQLVRSPAELASLEINHGHRRQVWRFPVTVVVHGAFVPEGACLARPALVGWQSHAEVRFASVSEMVRMGVRASRDRGQRVFRSSRVLATYDDAGRELARWEESDEHEFVLSLVQFVDLADGRRITTEGFAVLYLSVPPESTLAHLHNELREFVFEEELELEDDLDEPRWGALAAALAASGVAADAEALEALPFVIEVDADASAALRPWQARAASARALGRIGQQRGEACHGEVDPERHGSADAASCSHTFATRTPIVAFGTIFDARSRQ